MNVGADREGVRRPIQTSGTEIKEGMGPQGNIRTLLPKWYTEVGINEEHNLFFSNLMY